MLLAPRLPVVVLRRILKPRGQSVQCSNALATPIALRDCTLWVDPQLLTRRLFTGRWATGSSSPVTVIRHLPQVLISARLLCRPPSLEHHSWPGKEAPHGRGGGTGHRQ
jgi:hypothetical protein